MLSLSPCISLSLSLMFFPNRNPSLGLASKFARSKARFALWFAPPPSSCRACHFCARNRAGRACAELGAPFLFLGPGGVHRRFRASQAPSFLSESVHASRVWLRSSPSLFPSLSLPGNAVRRRCCSAAARLIADGAPVTSRKRRHPRWVARVAVTPRVWLVRLIALGNARLRLAGAVPLRR